MVILIGPSIDSLTIICILSTISTPNDYVNEHCLKSGRQNIPTNIQYAFVFLSGRVLIWLRYSSSSVLGMVAIPSNKGKPNMVVQFCCQCYNPILDKVTVDDVWPYRSFCSLFSSLIKINTLKILLFARHCWFNTAMRRNSLDKLRKEKWRDGKLPCLWKQDRTS